MPKINIFTVILFLFIAMDSYAQMPISDADTEKLGYKKMIKYFEKSNLVYFSEIKPSINNGSDLNAFYIHNAKYTVNAPVERVWNTCTTTSPASLWKGKTLGLSCVYSKNSDKIFYCDDQQFDILELNQIYFINLHIMRLFNVAAALITTNIDPDEKIFEFTYIEGNKSIGKQTVSLLATNENETTILHDTQYKSDSKFRDKRLYSHFHQISITDLHKKIDMYMECKQ